ncbi:hypothetical protein DM02DRAFT_611535 [Periconia macrospinosa]|uniref:RanBP2-type domain-containing protein n=1 Tax=Periconia macrospinosa TaxID=97972 RepID=A0A2V1E2Y6_9PLEO|nr:hypothetical protein DM02DRAFT_611535 [Periconia macrospinosa]
MDIPRGHAMLPLNETDFLDFIYNYYKAEYAPIRSLWSTATAIPNSPQRWQRMGNELFPLSFRPANAQAQKDLDSLDYFLRKWNLDATFIRGIVIRYAKYEEHERLEKKLYECSRVDLMVRKALKEKHLIDKLWPSPAPRNIPHELLQQGVQVRKWYGDMFGKYFKHLHSVEDFVLRPEVDAKIKASTTLMLVPWVDHLVFGTVHPIMPIVAKGSGYTSTGARNPNNKQVEEPSFGEPARLDIRFDAPAEVTETYVKNAVRQCQCLKCGSKRDVHVNISVDPNPGPQGHTEPRQRRSNLAADSSKQNSRAAQRYRPGYNMPNNQDNPQPQQPSALVESQNALEAARSSSPDGKKQCPRCTFLNHPDLTVCEMCQGELPNTLVTSPTEPSSPPPQSGPSHSHSASVPSASTQPQKEAFRPSLPSRQSLGSTLFSIFPFSQQHQSEHHANLPPTQPSSNTPGMKKQEQPTQTRDKDIPEHRPALPARRPTTPPPPPLTTTATTSSSTNDHDENTPTSPISSHTEMAMMPLTPPPPTSSSQPRAMPAGMPQNLMDDFVPVSSSPFLREEEEKDAGWGEMSREEARRGVDGDGDDDDDDDEDGRGRGRSSREGLLDLDAVAREEMGVWGEEQ